MGKLKSALGAQQHQAKQAKLAAAKEAAKNAKVVRSAGEKRALKRQRRDKEEKERARIDAGRKAAAEKRAAREAMYAKEMDVDAAEDTPKAESEEVVKAEVDAEDAAASAVALSRNVGRATLPLALDDTILLLGEANFSFAVALLKRGHAGHLMCATAYDSEAECCDKYPDAAANIAALKAAGAHVGFNVDGGAIEKSKVVGKGKRWSRVVFNFPHAGKGIQDQDRNIRSNQEMLLRTMRSVAPVLTEGPSAFPLVEIKRNGKKIKVPKALAKKRARAAAAGPGPVISDDEDAVDADALDDDDEEPFAPAVPIPASFLAPSREGTLLITLLDQAPYSLWDVRALAVRPPMLCPGTKLQQPKYRLLRSFEFVPQAYPGYAHRRTIGWREGKSFANNEEILGRKGRARTHEFALKEEDD